MIDREKIKEIIEEYSGSQDMEHSEAASISETVLFLENTFNIRINDSEICTENLGTTESMVAFVLLKTREI